MWHGYKIKIIIILSILFLYSQKQGYREYKSWHDYINRPVILIIDKEPSLPLKNNKFPYTFPFVLK